MSFDLQYLLPRFVGRPGFLSEADPIRSQLTEPHLVQNLTDAQMLATRLIPRI
jgi:hypothetical protein